ncbi:hypothetical protein ACFOWZ_13395 [Lentzea rhizosphaerae]|uniref:Fibronectin type-III domain-containing protein n=1 Tax=Lentzea rhizosphaerae TaxID=2041025 RepID=A0ABV8BTA1_9PSEU
MRRALSTLLIAAGVTVFAVTPASAAAAVPRTLPITGQGHTDLREPARTLTGQDSPVGAWRDAENRFHSSKAYVTVDLKQLRGNRIISAAVYSRETAVTDCAKPRSVELWQTKLAEQPTWFSAPRELTRFDIRVTGECHALVSWDVTDAVTKAVAAGQEKATFALRMAGGRQYDTGYGRRYAPMSVQVTYNTPPSPATDPVTGGKPCTATPLPVGAPPSLFAKVTDADPVPGFGVRYVVTDVADPAKRHEAVDETTDNPYTYLPASFLEHGHTYEWTARGEDGWDSGPSSTPCRFTADLVAPSTPAISSTDFTPSGPTTGAGLPGEFTFDAQGDEDVVEFQYRLRDGALQQASADRPGGKATVTVRVPFWGDNSIEVFAVDRVGHYSNSAIYQFKVRYSGPSVRSFEEAQLGSEVEVSMSSVEANVTSFVYQVGNGPELTVPAVAGAAKVTVRVTSPYSTSVSARAKTADGDLTQSSSAFIRTKDSTPTITRNGDLYTFAPGMPGVVEYVYSVNSGPEQVVAAGPDGTVTLPLDLGEQEFPPPSVDVRSRTADGLQSLTATYYRE